MKVKDVQLSKDPNAFDTPGFQVLVRRPNLVLVQSHDSPMGLHWCAFAIVEDSPTQEELEAVGRDLLVLCEIKKGGQT